MSMPEFYLLLDSDLSGYFVILLSVILAYYFILKGAVWSYADPLFISFLSSAFSTSVVVFLYKQKAIELPYLLSFISTQAAFLLGFVSLNVTRKEKLIDYSDSKILTTKLTFILCVFIFIVSQTGVYVLSGVPALSESRLEQYYSESPLVSLFNRIIPVTRALSVWFAIYFIVSKSNLLLKIISKATIVIVFLSYILSGSKSSFIEIIFILFVFQWWNAAFISKKSSKKFKEIITFSFVLVFLLALLVISLRNEVGSGPGVFLYLIARFIQSGDTFVYAFPNDVVLSLQHSNFISALFPGIASTIFDTPKDAPLGFQLAQYVNGFDLQEAPNSRHNVFALLHFGFVFAPIYSGFVGCLLGFICRSLYRQLNKDVITGSFFLVCYLSIAGIEADANFALGIFTGAIFIAPLIIGIAMIFSYLMRAKVTGKVL